MQRDREHSSSPTSGPLNPHVPVPGGAELEGARPPRPDASDATLILRLTLATILLAAGVASLFGDPGRWKAAQGWLPPGRFALPPALYAGALAAVGVLLVLGWRTQRAALAATAVALAVHVEWLRLDPMYAPLQHVVPLLVLGLGTAALAASGDRFGVDALVGRARVLDVRPAALLVARLFVGTLFVAQGWMDAFRGAGIVEFARKVYVEPYRATFLPEWALWVAGVMNPIVQLATGVAILVGLRTRLAARVAGLFLVTIVFGHAVVEPFDTPSDLHQYALQNLAAVIAVLLLARGGDPLGVDRFVRRRASVAPELPGSGRS